MTGLETGYLNWGDHHLSGGIAGISNNIHTDKCGDKTKIKEIY
jgi:hypothetical protein